MTTEEKFLAAVNVIESLPKDGPFQPSEDLMLKFYSYYKQATLGPCNVSKPHFWDIVNKQKWEAWKSLGEMSEEDAMDKYISELVKIIETMSYSESVSNFMDLIGPFYESVSFGEADIDSSTVDDCPEKKTTDTAVKSSNSTVMVENICKNYPGFQKTCEYIEKEASESLRIFSRCPEENSSSFKQTESITYEFAKKQRNSKLEFDDKILDNSIIPQNNKEVFMKNTRWSSKLINCISQKNVAADTQNSSDAKSSPVCLTKDWLPSIAEHCKVWQCVDEKKSPAMTFNSFTKNFLIDKHHHQDEDTKNVIDLSVREMLTLSVKKLQHSLEEVIRHLDSLEDLVQNYKLARHKNTCKPKSFGLGLSPWITIFILIWPFVTHSIICLMHWKKRR